MKMTYVDPEGLSHSISANGEMMNLTDMWKAAGSPAQRGPYDWRRLPETSDFIEQLSLNTGKSRVMLLVAKPGRGGATSAHWQIGLAYAKCVDDRKRL